MSSRSGVLLSLVVLAGPVFANNFSQYCNLCSDHTLCVYEGVGSTCAPRLGGGVSHEDRDLIVSLHNKLRQRVALGKETRGSPGPQPSAANMMAVSWDPELATIAQHHADQCVFKHDACRRVSRFRVGQNIGWVYGRSGLDWKRSITGWYDEVSQFDRNYISVFKSGQNTGHYTQLVWADSYLVGCGHTTYHSRSRLVPEHLYVCNYGPVGNVVNSAVYVKGPPASKCRSRSAENRKNKEYPGLCP